MGRHKQNQKRIARGEEPRRPAIKPIVKPAASPSSEKPAEATSNLRYPIPDFNRADYIFGKADHLPPYNEIPDEFKSNYGEKRAYVEFISEWFFGGLKSEDLTRLKERQNVERGKALAAIKVALNSFDPSHEHKMAGCAFLLHEWFELA